MDLAELFDASNRPLRVETPLGPTSLAISAFRGREAVSQLYEFQLTLLGSPTGDIDFSKVLGKPAKVSLDDFSGLTTRYFHGIFTSFAEVSRDDQFTQYEATLAPKHWLMGLTRNCRIFQRMTVPQVLKEVFTGYDVDILLKTNYPHRDYLVQYEESDLDFAMRLMEEVGIYFYFHHENDKLTMILCDQTVTQKSIDGISALIYEQVIGGVRPENRVYTWRREQRITTKKVALRDIAFQMTGQDLDASADIVKTVNCGLAEHDLHAVSDLPDERRESYVFHSGYAGWFDDVNGGGGDQSDELGKTQGAGDESAKIDAQRIATTAVRCQGNSDIPRLMPGYLFTLLRHPNADDEYQLLEVEHDAKVDVNYRTNDASLGTDLHYENQMLCQPKSVQFRPQLVTPRPKIQGMQSARVVGPEKEEIFIDKYGRIKVKFAWDRSDIENENASCWIRVGQVWAGPRWGAFFWPRIGHEVIVAFEDGDIDRPIVVGSVYNSKNMPPLELPMNNQKGGIKSCIFQGDPLKNFNALVFHDVPGHQYLQVHSERQAVDNTESYRYNYTPTKHYALCGQLPG
ncbi:type VI secretion system Vgr family protein [Blastopirellula retiformator]|uniref:Phage-related baseplate assembly protein n=1 Tax=Blastopirellula retiformator TaxID=2527970 RepID=A0A5C5VKY8_9BACT|nr:type VI secretion system tip protein TssI/VgrG [Blastopirellula retiformator]TWT38382.1 Phage-related baseplate assembly protein [Blastopirellula retiformator]